MRAEEEIYWLPLEDESLLRQFLINALVNDIHSILVKQYIRLLNRVQVLENNSCQIICCAINAIIVRCNISNVFQY